MDWRYPGTREVDGLWWKESPEALFFSICGRDFNCDILHVAPRWIAWLYRFLPTRAFIDRDPQHKTGAPCGFFLWTVRAHTWWIAYLPARQARWRLPTLSVELLRWRANLPWGLKLINWLTAPVRELGLTLEDERRKAYQNGLAEGYRTGVQDGRAQGAAEACDRMEAALRAPTVLPGPYSGDPQPETIGL